MPLTPEACTGSDLAKLQIFEKILQGNIEGIAIADTQGIIGWVNDTFSLLSGYAKSDVIGTNVGALFAGGQNVYETMHPKLREASHRRAETQMCRKDGSRIPVLVTLSAVRSDADMITHHVLEFSDIAELRRTREELILRTRDLGRSNLELEQFAYVASHDLQEPLRMVASYTQLIGQRYRGKLDADADEFIGFAVDGAVRMQAIINDLLMLSRIGTHNMPFTRVDANQSLEMAMTNLRLAIDESGAKIVCGPLPMLDADSSQLTRLFQNLIGNAIKFRGDRRPVVETGAERQDGEWIFHVRDNGIGIAPEYFERVFMMFQRLHSRQEYSGTGIGLTICKKIIERHGGRIWIESEPGKGTTFFFSIPFDIASSHQQNFQERRTQHGS